MVKLMFFIGTLGDLRLSGMHRLLRTLGHRNLFMQLA